MNKTKKQQALQPYIYEIETAFRQVAESLGEGLPEKDYEKAMIMVMGEHFVSQPQKKAQYKGFDLGYKRPDAAWDNIALEYKIGKQLHKMDSGRRQCKAYIRLCGYDAAILMNFDTGEFIVFF